MITADINIEIKILTKYVNYLQRLDPIFGKIGIEPDIHRGGVRYQEENKELRIPKRKIATQIEIKWEDIRNFEIQKFCEEIYNFAGNYLESIHKMFIDTMNDVTDLTGNLLNVKGKKNLNDMFLDYLETIEISFDEDGNPKLSDYMMITGQKKLETSNDSNLTQEQNTRFTKIIEEKKKKYYDKKCYRKLSYIA